MIVQHIVFPKLSFACSEEMYLRGEYLLNHTKGELHIFKGESVRFNTFFNSFSLKTWKERCNISDVEFSVRGKGKLLLQFFYSCSGKPDQILYEKDIELHGEEVAVPLDFFNTIPSQGLIYPVITAIDDLLINSGNYRTNTQPRQAVRLGIVITHFNRQKSVIASAKRLQDQLLSDPAYKNIELVIVDNSQNLNLNFTSSSIHVVPNANFGGSGGFTRGLLYLKDTGFTHCCFMDDDASCEIESIRRIFVFFSYADSSRKYGISGALLIDKKPNLVYEAGAKYYRGHYVQMGHNMDLTQARVLLNFENVSSEANYGAWCFFSFKIASIEHLAFPFFVRGDDILFSIQNKLEIITLNGIVTWIDDFLEKDTPTTIYLSARSTYAITLLQNKMTLSRMLKILFGAHRDLLCIYKYAEVMAYEKATMDILKGPECFLNDMEGKFFRESLKPLNKLEQLEKIPYSPTYKMISPARENAFRKFIRAISLNGILLPNFMHKKIIICPKSVFPSRKDIFLAKSIIYLKESTGEGVIAEYSRKMAITRLLSRLKISYYILKNYSRVVKQYPENLEKMTSESFWRKIYSKAGLMQ
jgi:galactofuranosylgalactofuranosylrhamnosyl-N-acetylglucosaminyl-diphospho-decaprenol beta-1,5/1,6-galactofuranosyltransferase